MHHFTQSRSLELRPKSLEARKLAQQPHEERRTSSAAHRAAYAAAKAEPAAHKPRLITSTSVQTQVHGASAFGRLNARLAVWITKSVGTMWAAYLFAIIALVSLPQSIQALMKGDTVTAVIWLSQSFLQLVLLPIIIVGQNVISASQDARAEADHLTLTTLHAINVQQLQMLEQQRTMLQKQKTILDMLHPQQTS